MIFAVWEEGYKLAGAQDEWKASYPWVGCLQNAHCPNDRAATTFVHPEVLGWNSPVSLYGLRGVTNLSLAQFLGDDRVNGAIDLMSTPPPLPVYGYHALFQHRIVLSGHPLPVSANLGTKLLLRSYCTF